MRKIQSLQKSPVKLSLQFNREIEVSGEGLALALSTLCGNTFETIRFGFDLPESTREDIAQWTESDVEVSGTADKEMRELSGAVLNFSGGFDSLAAHYLIPEDHKLVSLEANRDRKTTRLNSSHVSISYAVFCLKKKNK